MKRNKPIPQKTGIPKRLFALAFVALFAPGLFTTTLSCSEEFPEGGFLDFLILIRLRGLPSATGFVLGTDTDPTYGEASMGYSFSPASDETFVDFYELYWANDGGRLGLLATHAAGTSISGSIPLNTKIPAGATKIRLESRNYNGEWTTNPPVLSFQDYRKYYIFVYTATTNGDLDSDNDGNAIDDADALCASDKDANFSSLPGAGSTYRAMIVDGTNRVACTSANCQTGGRSENVDWVFYDNTTYVRSDETTLFTTGSAGIHNFTEENLQAPLSTTPAVEWWTGLSRSWTNSDTTGTKTDANWDCQGWTSSGGPSPTGAYGSSTHSTDWAIEDSSFGSVYACNTALKLICVQGD